VGNECGFVIMQNGDHVEVSRRRKKQLLEVLMR